MDTDNLGLPSIISLFSLSSLINLHGTGSLFCPLLATFPSAVDLCSCSCGGSGGVGGTPPGCCCCDLLAVAAAAEEWLLRSGEFDRELLLESEEPEPGEEDLLSAAEEEVAEWEPPTIIRWRSAESVRYWLSRIELHVCRRIASFVEKACLHLAQLMSDPPPPAESCCWCAWWRWWLLCNCCCCNFFCFCTE